MPLFFAFAVSEDSDDKRGCLYGCPYYGKRDDFMQERIERQLFCFFSYAHHRLHIHWKGNRKVHLFLFDRVDEADRTGVECLPCDRRNACLSVPVSMDFNILLYAVEAIP